MKNYEKTTKKHQQLENLPKTQFFAKIVQTCS